ncbi:GDSL-type esterase/lipase family protein [Nocardiopsis changdeensis]|uniref:Lipase n=1 Tax=Nocardiopsis changdeensis TaxID=2831969 RepID=A0ABX8BXM4_9ACTN|nr:MULTISPECIES: GDSL-type esterase/lipase family protein [Nocardiopsis]QUX25566.1 lipase [Nocardiopsis changdeensis]QYX35952.1 lipase [Nocardiopsis sp. MT53]
MDPVTTPVTADLLRGAVEIRPTDHGPRPMRLPRRALAQAPDPMMDHIAAQTSGVRLALRTRATVVELDALPTKRTFTGAPPRPAGVYDLLVDGRLTAQGHVDGGDTLVIDMATGAVEHRRGPVGTVRFTGLPDRDKDVEIWLPHNEATIPVALRTDAPVAPAPAGGRRVWLHHGSSISHGSDAAGPTATWPAVAALRAGVDLVNLGLSGNAMVDPFTARTLREVPADAISVKLGINVVNQDALHRRAFGPAVHGFLDTVREGHPDTPLLVVSPIHCAIHEEVPGPTQMDMSALAEGRLSYRAGGDAAARAAGRLALADIRGELARIVADRAADDPHLHYLDGLELYGEADAAELPLPDSLHPDTAAHRRIGERFADLALGAGGPLA